MSHEIFVSKFDLLVIVESDSKFTFFFPTVKERNLMRLFASLFFDLMLLVREKV